MIRTPALGLLFTCLVPVAARAQETTRISVDSAGVEANDDSFIVKGAIGTVGGQPLVVFQSRASNLVTKDNNGKSDIFLRDVATGVTSRIVLDLNASDPDGDSFAARITPDGKFVVFNSLATDLVKSDKNAVQDVFVLDRSKQTIERVSLGASGNELNGTSLSQAISDDGRFVAFASFADDVVANDGNGTMDLFVRDRLNDQTICASLTPSGVTGDRPSDSGSLSADGATIAFTSDATDLVANDTNLRRDVFVRDLASGITTRVSVNDGGFEADDTSFSASLSRDGELVAFYSAATNLHRDSTHGIFQIFVRDLTTGELWLASRGIDGLAANGDCSTPSLIHRSGPAGVRALVAFSSTATNLPDDGGSDRDMFVMDFRGGFGQCITLDSSGTDEPDNHPSPNVGVTADGDGVLYTTDGDGLVPGDTNASFDVFLRGLQWTIPSEFGDGLAGAGGFVPHLSGEGGSCETGRWSIAIADGRGQAFGHLWVGFGRTNGFPLFGGTFYVDFTQPLFPIPLLLGGPAGVGGAGTLFLDGSNVEELGQFSIYLQCTFLDARAPKGVSLSNALEIAIDA